MVDEVCDNLTVNKMSNLLGDLNVKGKVGIGTTNPACELDIKASRIQLGLDKNGGGQLHLANNQGDQSIYLEAYKSDGSDTSAEILALSGAGSRNVPSLELLADKTFFNGNVGIGTTNPSVKLEVNGDIKVKAIQSKPAISSFKVEGKFDEFYPIIFLDNCWHDGPLILEINRPSIHTDSVWRGSLNSKFTIHSTSWGHCADMCRAEIYGSDLIAGYENYYFEPRFIIWLRGGGTTYYFRSNHFVTLEDFSATAKTLKTLDQKKYYPIKTSIDSYVLYSGIHLDKNLVIDGNVGIGTTTPLTNLDVVNGGRLNKIAIGTAMYGNLKWPYESIQLDPTHNLRINFGSRETAVFTNTGRLGIGTPAPLVDLEVVNGARLNQIAIGTALYGALPYAYESIQLDPAHNLRINFGSTETAVFENNGTLDINGNLQVKGDVILANADCAEDFDIIGAESIEPGTVMVIDNDGALRASEQAYDRRVAGVISGAGDFRPGITLDRQKKQANRLPLALTGKVYCKVDAEYNPVEVGDLLTTSPTTGHAMKVTDHVKSLGAIIGKALRPLDAGCGLIPILVALQ